MRRRSPKDLEAEELALRALEGSAALNLQSIMATTGLSEWRARGALQRLQFRGLVSRRRCGRAEGGGSSFFVWRAAGLSGRPTAAEARAMLAALGERKAAP